MRIVIIGASGNVGTALLRKLILTGDNHELHGIARRKPPPTEVYRSTLDTLTRSESEAVARS